MLSFASQAHNSVNTRSEIRRSSFRLKFCVPLFRLGFWALVGPCLRQTLAAGMPVSPTDGGAGVAARKGSVHAGAAAVVRLGLGVGGACFNFHSAAATSITVSGGCSSLMRTAVAGSMWHLFRESEVHVFTTSPYSCADVEASFSADRSKCDATWYNGMPALTMGATRACTYMRSQELAIKVGVTIF